MNKTSKHVLQASLVITATLLLLPFQAAHASATISIVGPVTVNATTLTIPGSEAFGFRPGIVSVSQGGKVSFSNNGYDQHTVTSYTIKVPFNLEGLIVQMPVPDGNFNSLPTFGPIFSGQTFTLDTTGLAPGDYTYFCLFHPWMQATVRITSGTSTPTASVNIDHHQGDTSQFFSGSASWGFLPRNLNVAQGTIVGVTNTAPIFHTFSSYTTSITIQEGFKNLQIPIGATAFAFNQTLAPGQSYNLDTGKLAKGTYTYACLFHPWMLGTLTVS